MDAKSVGAFICKLRKEKCFTQKQLADNLNVTDKAVSRWETGKGLPDVTSLLSISDYFNVSVNELLAGRRFETETAVEEANDTAVSIITQAEKRQKKNKILISVLAVLLALLVFISFCLICVYADELSSIELPRAISHYIRDGYIAASVVPSGFTINDYDVAVWHDEILTNVKKSEQGFYYGGDYGEYFGVVTLHSDDPDIDGLECEFGFVNTNDWYINTMHIFIEKTDDSIIATQAVTFLEDNCDVYTFTSDYEISIGSSKKLYLRKQGLPV